MMRLVGDLMRTKCCNLSKSAAIFKKHDRTRFSMSVTARGRFGHRCGGVKNVNANSDPVETAVRLKRHYEQSQAIQGESYANRSS
jgi:hypothetical protein